jgi:hypothetical protein
MAAERIVRSSLPGVCRARILRWRAAGVWTKTKSTARERRLARNYSRTAATRGTPNFDSDLEHTKSLLCIKVLGSDEVTTARTTFENSCEKLARSSRTTFVDAQLGRFATRSHTPTIMEVQLLQAECLEFASLLQPFVGGNSPGSTMYERRLVSLFGFDVQGLACLYLRLVALGGAQPLRRREHVLWALFWMRSNNTEAQCVAFFRSCTEKTFRHHVHHVVRCISQLSLVSCSPISAHISHAHVRTLRRSNGSDVSRTGRSSARVSASTASTVWCRMSATRGDLSDQLEMVVRTVLARSFRTRRTTPHCDILFA